MANDRKEVVVEGLGKCVLVKPSVGISREADYIYSRVFNECIRKGIPPAAILEIRLMESGSWSLEQEKEITTARGEYQTISQKLRDEKNEEKRNEMKGEWLESRNKLFALNSGKNSLYEHSAERKSDSRRLEFLVLNCSLKEDGKTRLWKNEDEAYAQETQFSEIVAEYLSYIAGINLDTIDTPPAPELTEVASASPEPTQASPTTESK